MASLWDTLAAWGQNYNPDPGATMLGAMQPMQGSVAAPMPSGSFVPQPQAAAQPAPQLSGNAGQLPSMASGQFPALSLGQRPQGFAAIKPAASAAVAASDDDGTPIAKGLAAGKALASSAGAPTDIRPAPLAAAMSTPAASSSGGPLDFLSTLANGARNIYGNGGAFDGLINLGIGMNSGPGGLQRALEQTSNQGQQRQAQSLQALNMALAQAKLAREQQGQVGTAAFIKQQYAAQGKPISDDQAAALAQNSGVVSSLASAGLKDDDKQVTTVTDPAERAALGIPAGDNRVVQKDANGKISFPGAGGVSVNLGDTANKGLDTKIIDDISVGKDKAIAASNTIQAIGRMGQALDSGQMITGSMAEQRLAIRNAVATALGIDDPAVINSQNFEAAANTKAAQIARAISVSGHTTNADLNMAKIISGSDPTYSQAALREIARQQQILAQDEIDRHNASIDKFASIMPDQSSRASYFRVPSPQPYDFGKPMQGTGQPAAAAAPSWSIVGP